MAFQCVTRSHVGRRRTLNEDAILAMVDVGLWAVADGMGGHEAGEIASSLVVKMLEDQVHAGDLSTRITAARDALFAANAALVSMAKTGPPSRTIGTTVVLIAANDRQFACLWAGDSRAYLARDGSLRQLTRDHSLVQELVDAGLWPASEAASHPDAHVIRRAVGAEDRLDIDCTEGDLAEDDIFLLASDGLTRLVSDAEILTCLQASDLATAADWLIDCCLERGAPDNISVILMGPVKPNS